MAKAEFEQMLDRAFEEMEKWTPEASRELKVRETEFIKGLFLKWHDRQPTEEEIEKERPDLVGLRPIALKWIYKRFGKPRGKDQNE